MLTLSPLVIHRCYTLTLSTKTTHLRYHRWDFLWHQALCAWRVLRPLWPTLASHECAPGSASDTCDVNLQEVVALSRTDSNNGFTHVMIIREVSANNDADGKLTSMVKTRRERHVESASTGKRLNCGTPYRLASLSWRCLYIRRAGNSDGRTPCASHTPWWPWRKSFRRGTSCCGNPPHPASESPTKAKHDGCYIIVTSQLLTDNKSITCAEASAKFRTRFCISTYVNEPKAW